MIHQNANYQRHGLFKINIWAIFVGKKLLQKEDKNEWLWSSSQIPPRQDCNLKILRNEPINRCFVSHHDSARHKIPRDMLRYVTMIVCKNGKIWFLGFSNQQMYVHQPWPTTQENITSRLATALSQVSSVLRLFITRTTTACAKNGTHVSKKRSFPDTNTLLPCTFLFRFQMLPKSKSTYPLDERSKDTCWRTSSQGGNQMHMTLKKTHELPPQVLHVSKFETCKIFWKWVYQVSLGLVFRPQKNWAMPFVEYPAQCPNRSWASTKCFRSFGSQASFEKGYRRSASHWTNKKWMMNLNGFALEDQ